MSIQRTSGPRAGRKGAAAWVARGGWRTASGSSSPRAGATRPVRDCIGVDRLGVGGSICTGMRCARSGAGGSGLEVGRRLVGCFVVEAIVAARRRERWGAHRKAQAGADCRRGLGRVDRRDDPHRAAAARTLEYVEREDALHQRCPGDPSRPRSQAGPLALATGIGGFPSRSLSGIDPAPNIEVEPGLVADAAPAGSQATRDASMRIHAVLRSASWRFACARERPPSISEAARSPSSRGRPSTSPRRLAIPPGALDDDPYLAPIP